jgi:Uma2 family endonuclease
MIGSISLRVKGSAQWIVSVSIDLPELELPDAIGDSGFVLARNPDTVLAPDVAFISTERLPKNSSGYLEIAPDLAVEIVSPGNTPGEIERKVAIYLRSGVEQVWIVYPEEREVVIHAPSGPPSVYLEHDQIDGGSLLPGLNLRVTDIFT